MSFPLKKIIAYRDFKDYFYKLDIVLKQEVYSPYCAGDFRSLIPHPDEQKSHTIKKIDTPLFNKSGLGKFIVKVGDAGVFYLELRSGNMLECISVEPMEVVVDVYYGYEDRLVYSFYNPSDNPTLSVTTVIKKDVDRIYEQIKVDPGDIFWRQSFIREAIVSAQGQKQRNWPALMTAGQLAKYLQVTEKTIRNWTSLKKIPCEKIGHTTRYRKSAIDNLNKPEK